MLWNSGFRLLIYVVELAAMMVIPHTVAYVIIEGHSALLILFPPNFFFF